MLLNGESEDINRDIITTMFISVGDDDQGISSSCLLQYLNMTLHNLILNQHYTVKVIRAIQCNIVPLIK